MSSILYKYFITWCQDCPSGSGFNFFNSTKLGKKKKGKHGPIGLLMWGINSSMKIVDTQPISHIILFRVRVQG
jgi:hypothetical protein